MKARAVSLATRLRASEPHILLFHNRLEFFASVSIVKMHSGTKTTHERVQVLPPVQPQLVQVYDTLMISFRQAAHLSLAKAYMRWCQHSTHALPLRFKRVLRLDNDQGESRHVTDTSLKRRLLASTSTIMSCHVTSLTHH